MTKDIAIDSVRPETLLAALVRLNTRYACVVLGSGCIAQGEELFGTRRRVTVADGDRTYSGPRVNPVSTTRRSRP